MKGVVVKYNGSRGFGFIRSDKLEDDIFVHIKSVTNAKHLKAGDVVTFETEETPKGLAAVSVKVGGDDESPTIPGTKYGLIAALVAAVLLALWLILK